MFIFITISHKDEHFFDDDTIYTTEGFATRCDQFMVEPFTLHSAIGVYHGKDTLRN